MVTEKDKSRWFIDFDWYRQHNRSFWVVAQHSLCPRCRNQLRERLEGDTYRTTSEILSRLLSHDRYYGLRKITN